MIYEMNSLLNFGKHKGKTPRQIEAMGDADYLCWLSFYFKGKKDSFAPDVIEVVERNFGKNPKLRRILEQKFSNDGSNAPGAAISAALAKRADQIDAFGQQVQIYAEDFGSF